MTDYQDALVLENLDLVNWVIRTRISIPNRPLLTYDDFYAIGCEAICRAALKYQPDMGAFAPFACRYIYNAIVDHCRAMNYRLERSVEISEDENASLLDTRRLMNIAKLLKQGKVNFFEAVYLLQPDKGTEAEQRIMKLVAQTPLSVPELVRCFENDVRDVSSADKVISAIYTEESDNQARLNNACSLSNHRQDVLEATTNLYLTRQVILEHA